ncbi:major facilitator superfamily domain-containing protein [Aspergillus granulosus]|uniref:Major facilitator superfamily domain-containing protein n=1 Tax=Aspergillus granulosus TaxID=176169 RepID=A0ABR4H7K1_9EURO
MAETKAATKPYIPSGHELYPVMDLHHGIVGWESQEDPLNPRNYPLARKWFLLILVSSITLISPFSSSVFAPAVLCAQKDLGDTSPLMGSLSVTSYLFGYGAGPLLFSPLSEIYGRRIVLSAANAMFVLFQIACAVAPTIPALITFRTLAGIGGSACLTTGGGVVADLFTTEQRGLAMSVFTFGPLFGPVLGPICGGFIAEKAGWRWVFWILSISGGLLTAFVMVFNRETNPVVLIQRKTERLRKELRDPSLKSGYELTRTVNSDLSSILYSLSFPFRLLFFSPIVFLVAAYIATIYGCLYLLFTTVTGVYQDVYGWSTGLSGLSSIGLGLGFLTGQTVFGLLSDRIILHLTARNNDVFEPEMRVSICVLFAPFIPISFFWYGWSVQSHTHWIIPIIGLFPFAFGAVGLFSSLQTYVVDSYTQHAASGIAAITVFRSFIGALLPLAGPSMYEALGYGWGNSLLGFLALAMVPVPIGFYLFGRRLRRKFTVNTG